MKMFRLLTLAIAAALILSSIASAAPSPYTGSQPIQSAGPGDVTTYLGPNPFFPNGLVLDAYGNQYKFVTDSTATTPAAVGKWLYWNGTSWLQAASANIPLHPGMYGVVVVAASAQGGQAVIQTQGYDSAVSVKTGGSVACAATGDVPMAITATGDVTPTTAATVPGVTWGICAQVLAISQPATLIAAYIGGY